MKWKGTEEDAEFTADAIDDDFDEDEYPNWEKQKKFSVKDTLLKKAEVPFILVGAGLVVLIVVIFVSMTGKKNTIEVSRIEMLEQRLGAIEDRLFKLEGINIPAETIGEQNRTLDGLKLKISKLETDVATRMDQLSSDLAKLGKKAPSVVRETPVVQKETPVKEAPAKTLYHQVRSGDTLFGIGRKYDVSVEELRKMNNLSQGKAIYPGQKLIVGTSKSP